MIEMLVCSGLSGNPAYPKYTVPYPPIPIGILGQTLAKGFNKLGWHWWPSDVAILSEDDNGRQKCVNAGTCDLGQLQAQRVEQISLTGQF